MDEPDSTRSSASGEHAPKGAPPEDPEGVLVASAESLLATGQLAEAEKAIRAALKISIRKPQDQWGYYIILGRIWSAQGRAEAAIEAFRHAVSKNALRAPPHGALAEQLLKQGELEEAEIEARDAIRLFSAVSSYHATLGAVLLRKGSYKEAYASITRSIRLDRTSTHPRVLLSQLFAAQGKYRRATWTLKWALLRASKPLYVRWSLCKLLEDQGKTDQAVKCAKRIADLDRGSAKTHVRVGSVLRRAGRLGEAEESLRAALALEPTAANYLALSQVLVAQSRIAEASAAVAEACRLDPNDQSYQRRLKQLASKDPRGNPEGPQADPDAT